MVRNDITKAYYRADHLLEGHLSKLIEDPKTTAEQKQEYSRIAVGFLFLLLYILEAESTHGLVVRLKWMTMMWMP